MFDIWTINLRRLSPEISNFLSSLLSPEDRAKAQRYTLPDKRRNFALARGILRHVLSEYVSHPPQSLIFRLGIKGKPELANQDIPRTFFNLSHSRDYVCLGISPDRRIGVDIEAMDKDLGRLDKIATFAFSPLEVETLLKYPAHARVRFFYILWTAKEAYVKGTGEGLSRLKDISCHIQCTPASFFVQGIQEDDRWSLHHFQPAPYIQGTVAVEGKGSVLISHRTSL